MKALISFALVMLLLSFIYGIWGDSINNFVVLVFQTISDISCYVDWRVSSFIAYAFILIILKIMFYLYKR